MAQDLKGISTLIKLHRRQLDELRQEQAEKEKLLAAVELARAALLEQWEEEKRLAGQDASVARYLADFAKGARMRRKLYDEQIVIAHNQIEALRERIREAFGELKKFETLRDRREAEQKQGIARREQQQMDELAGRRHSRKDAS